MSQKDNKGKVLQELQEIQQSEEPGESNSTALVKRTENALVRSGFSTSKARQLILPSRRQFLTTAAGATAGLMITPLDGWATFQSGVAIKPFEVFKKFGTAILYNWKDALPTIFPGFGNLLNVAIDIIRQIFGKNRNWEKGGFGNVANIQNATKIIAAVLNATGFNLSAPWLVKGGKKIFQVLQTVMSIADTATKVFGNQQNLQGVSHYFPRPVYFLNAKNEAQEEQLELQYQTEIRQNYFMPKLDGKFGKIAEGTHSNARVLNKRFDTPIFAETESGALIMTTYTDVSFNSSTRKGVGKLEFFTVPPHRRKGKSGMDKFISNNWSDLETSYFNSELVRQSLSEKMKAASVGSFVRTYSFEGDT